VSVRIAKKQLLCPRRVARVKAIKPQKANDVIGKKAGILTIVDRLLYRLSENLIRTSIICPCYERMQIMRKLATLSLVLLLAIGCFITGCQKKEGTPSEKEKAEVKTPAEKTAEAPAEK